MNNGQWQIDDEIADWPLDRWLASARRLGSTARARFALERGRIFVNDAEQTLADAERPLRPGDIVSAFINRVNVHLLPFEDIPFDHLDIIHEDRYVLVINKPAGLLSTPHPHWLWEASLFDIVEEYLNAKRQHPFIVHRIDRGTTGLVLFAKTLEAQEKLKEQFKAREPERVYLAVTQGAPEPESGTWRDAIKWDGRISRFRQANIEDERTLEAVSHYRTLERYAAAAQIEVRLVTGKRNQIRLQAQLHGHPLIGERIFNGDPATSDIQFNRQALHAYRLSFRHPINNRILNLEAPPPSDFTELLERMRSGKRCFTGLECERVNAPLQPAGY